MPKQKQIRFLKREEDLKRKVRIENGKPRIAVANHLYIDGNSVEEAIRQIRQAAEHLEDPTVHFEKETCYCYSYDCSCSDVFTVNGFRSLTVEEENIWRDIEEKQAQIEAQQALKDQAAADKAKADKLAKEKKEYERLKRKFG